MSSDGDWRLLNSMKFRSEPDFQINFLLAEDYRRLQVDEPCYLQDATHIGTKLRNRLLKKSILLMFGYRIISVAHLQILLKNVPKDQHGLVYKDIVPDDRQNYNSLQKVMRPEVSNALSNHVFDSEATVVYLKICRYVTSSCLDPDLQPLERVYFIWCAVFILRIWRKWLSSSENYKTGDNFITQNCYECVEVNALDLIRLITKLRDIGKPEWFLTYLFDSQPCESTFRQMRSMGTLNFTKINFTLSELLNIVERVELQNEIVYNKLSKSEIKFPRLKVGLQNNTIAQLPSNQELATTMKKALEDARTCTIAFGMDAGADEIVKCPLRKPVVLGLRNIPEDSDSSNEEESIFNSRFDSRQSLNLPEYNKDKVSLTEDSKFIEVCQSDGSSQIFRKSSVVWLLTESTAKLSSDRLKRVQEVPKQKSSKRAKREDSNTSSATGSSNEPPNRAPYIFENIKVGDWCFFELDFDNNSIIGSTIESGVENLVKNIVVGAILAFKYAQGNKEKDKQYHLDTAPVHKKKENDRDIDVLCNWRCIKIDGTLCAPESGFFIPIKNYVCTVELPRKLLQNQEKTLIVEMNGLEDFLSK